MRISLINRLFFVLAIVLSASSAYAQQLRFATLAPDGSPWMRELRKAADEVKTATQGRVTVRFFPGGVMGNDAVVLRKMRLGQLQGGVLTSSELSLVYTDAPIYSVPFIFDNWEQVDKARAQLDPQLAKGFSEKGFHMLGASGVGFAYLMSAKPLRGKDDLRASKLWVPQNDLLAERTFKKGGVNPIPLPIGDVFTSLQTGLIDTVANTPAGAVALQWHGKVKHLFDLPLTYVIGFMVVDNKAWSKITPADQKLVDAAFQSAGGRIDQIIRKDDIAALEAMKKQGIQVFKPSAEEVAFFRSIGNQVTAEFEQEKLLTPALLKSLRAAVGQAAPAAASAKP